jgi:D-3-phosphoglycerate dehydrogenase
VELFDKTVGIIGLGRIGALVAERLAGFGVRLIGFDPYIQPTRAAQLGVELVDMPTLMAESDFITIHIPKTPETTGMVSDAEFALAKPELRIVNASRGGIIDEDALHRALTSGTIAGAALDVFSSEPPTGSPLLELPNIVLTPHLGASTDEAQEKAGVSVARSVKLALEGELVPDAVNVAGGVIDPSVRPGIGLMEKLGQVFIGLAGSSLSSVEVEVRGEIAQHDVSVLKLAALKGIFQPIVSEQVSYVNAPLLAESRGVRVGMTVDSDSGEYRNVLCIRGILSDGKTVSVSATLMGPKQSQKIVEINGYDIEVPLATHHVVMVYRDRPGIVAVYGKEFGDAGINIAGMQIARKSAGGEALSVLTVDSRVPDDILDRVATAIDATQLSALEVIEL